jgi:hypothetical protein
MAHHHQLTVNIDNIDPGRLDDVLRRFSFGRYASVGDYVSPLAAHYRDVLRTADGDFTVCRVAREDCFDTTYVCTNGATTRHISLMEAVCLKYPHFRNGVRLR